VSSGTKKPPSIDAIGEVLDKSLSRLELSRRLDEYGIWPIWGEVVGEAIARNAQPEKIRNGTLFVKVSSPVWMQELQFMKEMIAEKLNHRLAGEVVKNIFFMVGKIDAAPAASVERRSETAEAHAVPINEEFLHSIEDPEIRAAFQKLVKSFARRRAKA
jgi:predicted nucleic acid-binding Zn ribbon protein